ncbi:hypothetical protein DFJ73DRAFT_760415 [Zopfochytrium polystomum]|nr:hypothetical protein DFJ73DRAFT_760415 [Zopfochytrium polystomum]
MSIVAAAAACGDGSEADAQSTPLSLPTDHAAGANAASPHLLPTSLRQTPEPLPRQSSFVLSSLPVSVIERILAALKAVEKCLVPPSKTSTAEPTEDATPPSSTNDVARDAHSPPQDSGASSTSLTPLALPASFHCLTVSRPFSLAAARSLYFRPYLQSSRQFLSFLSTCMLPSPAHPYSSLVRQLDLLPHVASDLDLGDLDIALQLFPNLAHFRIGPSPTATNVLVQSIADHLGSTSALRRLEIRGCPVTDASVGLVLRSCPGIRWLDLSETGCSVGGVMTAIVECGGAKGLGTLRLSGVSGVWKINGPSRKNSTVGEGLRALATAVSRALVPAGVSACGTSGAGAKRLGRLPLVQVDVSRAVHMTDDDLRLLVGVCGESVRTLSLAGCSLVTDEGIARVARACRSLRTLDLSFIPTLSDWGVMALGRRVVSPSAYDDELGLQLTDEPRLLESLNVSGCPLVTPFGVASILPKSAAAAKLSPPDEERVDPAILSFMAEMQVGCPYLRELVVSGCGAILNSFVRRFSTSASVAFAGTGGPLDSLECVLRGAGLLRLAEHCANVAMRTQEATPSPARRPPSPRDSIVSSVATKVDSDERVELADCGVQTDTLASTGKLDDSKLAASESTEQLLKFASAMATGSWKPPSVVAVGTRPSEMLAAYWQHWSSEFPAVPAKDRKTRWDVFEDPLCDADFSTATNSLLDLDMDPATAMLPPLDDLDSKLDSKRVSFHSSTSSGSDYSSAFAMAEARRLRAAPMPRNGVLVPRILPSRIPAPVTPAKLTSSNVVLRSALPVFVRSSGSVSTSSASTAVSSTSAKPMAVSVEASSATSTGYKPRQFKRYNADIVDTCLSTPTKPKATARTPTVTSLGSAKVSTPTKGTISSPRTTTAMSAPKPSTPSPKLSPSRSTVSSRASTPSKSLTASPKPLSAPAKSLYATTRAGSIGGKSPATHTKLAPAKTEPEPSPVIPSDETGEQKLLREFAATLKGGILRPAAVSVAEKIGSVGIGSPKKAAAPMSAGKVPATRSTSTTERAAASFKGPSAVVSPRTPTVAKRTSTGRWM